MAMRERSAATQPGHGARAAARQPRSEGPRERIHDVGPEALSDRELVTLLLGQGVRGAAATELAARLLSRHGGLRGLARAAAAELAAERGIGPARSATLAAAVEVGRRLAGQRLRSGAPISGPADVFHHFHARLRDAPHERFVAVLLDARHRWLREVVVSQGTLTASLVHPREVFRAALREGAAALLLVHNHPSGDPSPSREDREITLRLARAGELLGVRVLDHVVVAEQGYVSLREEGVFPEPGSGSPIGSGGAS